MELASNRNPPEMFPLTWLPVVVWKHRCIRATKTDNKGPTMSMRTIGRPSGRATFITAGLALVLAACSGGQSASEASSLQLVSTSGMLAEGMRGEALPPTNRGFVIRNRSDETLDWEVEVDSDWLRVPGENGSLAAGSELFIPVQLIEDAVFDLEPMLHRGSVTLQENEGTGAGLTVPFDLLVLPRPASFAVLDAPQFSPVGTEDGEFFPKETTWRFENDGDMTLAWGFESDADWLDVAGGRNGLLDPTDKLDLVLRVDEFIASRMGVGEHEAQVRLIDLASGEVAVEQTFNLAVSTGLTLQDGWSALRGSVGSRIVFVSASLGDDANDGLSLQTPKRTIAAGKALMRHGEPDYLLLRRGDVFNEGLGQWKTAGRSLTDRQVVSSYGPPTVRPILRTGSSGGLVTHGGGGSPPSIDNVAFMGLHFLADTHDGTGQPVGIALHQPSTNILIEDCYVERYNTGIVIQGIGGRHSNVALRRSIVADSFGVNDGNPQGLYCVNTDGFLIEECIFDTNGWQPDVPGATADIFSHNIYIDTDTSDVIVRGNIIANGASHGAQMRSGGVAHNNLFVRNSIALMMAGGSGPELNTAHAILNVIVDGKDIDAANPRGWGIDFNDIVGGEMRRNLIANNPNGHLPIPILLDGGGFGSGVHNVSIVNNIIWNWGGSVWFTGEAAELTGIEFFCNDIQNGMDNSFLVDHFTTSNVLSVTSSDNRFYSDVANSADWMHQAGINQSVPEWKHDVGDDSSTMARTDYADPDRFLADYSASLGHAATHEAFMAELRKQSRFNWRRRYTAHAVNHWFRQGF